MRVWLGICAPHSLGIDDPARLAEVDTVPTEREALLRWADKYRVRGELIRPAAEVTSEHVLYSGRISVLDAAAGEPGGVRLKLQREMQVFLAREAAIALGPAARLRLWKQAHPSDTLRPLATRMRELIGDTTPAALERLRFVITRPVAVDEITGRCRGLIVSTPFVDVTIELSGYEQRAPEGS